MVPEPPVVVQQDAVPPLLEYLNGFGSPRLALVADHNTYDALGRRVEAALAAQGMDITRILLEGDEIVPDEATCMQVFLANRDDQRIFLAVGSGVITDVVRFTSHRSRNPFVSVPTAPSVDAYTATGSSLVVNRLKQTIPGQGPIAVFADLETLCAAPQPMIAAGFGDVVAKYTSLADWKLSHLLLDAPYSAPIAQRMQVARDRCMEDADRVAAAQPAAIHSLIVALVEAGLCMLQFGGSQPAGQSEHYISHYLEMKLVQEGRPAVLHGAKTGMATVIVARYHDQIRRMTRDQAAQRLEASQLPNRQQEIERIRSVYGPLTDLIVTEQAAFLAWTENDYERLKQRILDRWAEVQEVSAGVPSPEALARLLERAGGTADHRALGLGDDEVATAERYSHYVRNRFTVMKLSRILGLLP